MKFSSDTIAFFQIRHTKIHPEIYAIENDNLRIFSDNCRKLFVLEIQWFEDKMRPTCPIIF